MTEGNSSRIQGNIAANFAVRGWGFLSVYLFVPLYLNFLGMEAFGLVGFYSMLLGVLAFADMGFSSTLNREMARLSMRDDSDNSMGEVLRAYEAASFCIATMLAIVIWALAPLIAESWLQYTVLQSQDVVTAIRAMGVSIGLQLLSGLYIGGLMGLQRQVLANTIQIAWITLRGVGAVGALWIVSPTIGAFAVWQVIANALCCVAVRSTLWHVVPLKEGIPRFKWQVFRNTWRYAAGMTGMTLVSTLLSQADKIAVSKMLPLETLGQYTLAGTLASIPLLLAGPVAFAVFPRFTGLAATGAHHELVHLYHWASEWVAAVVLPAGLTLALFSTGILRVWTGFSEVYPEAGLLSALLVVGYLMQALAIMPFYLALAQGNIRLNLQLGMVSVLLLSPLLICLIMVFGVVGAGLSWLLMNICVLPPYVFFLHRKLLPGELKRWLLRSVCRPLFISLSCVLLGWYLVPATSSGFLTLCFIGLVWAIAATVTALTVYEWRKIPVGKTFGFLGTDHV